MAYTFQWITWMQYVRIMNWISLARADMQYWSRKCRSDDKDLENQWRTITWCICTTKHQFVKKVHKAIELHIKQVLRWQLNTSCTDNRDWKYPWWQGSWGQHGAHLGLTRPKWAPCWPNELCYLGHHFTVELVVTHIMERMRPGRLLVAAFATYVHIMFEKWNLRKPSRFGIVYQIIYLDVNIFAGYGISENLVRGLDIIPGTLNPGHNTNCFAICHPPVNDSVRSIFRNRWNVVWLHIIYCN